MQEKLTAQVAKALWEELAPHGVAVVNVNASACANAVRKPGAWTTTNKLYGAFLENSRARMNLALIGARGPMDSPADVPLPAGGFVTRSTRRQDTESIARTITIPRRIQEKW